MTSIFFVFRFFIFILVTVTYLMGLQINIFDEKGPKTKWIPDYSPFKNKDLARFSPSYHESKTFKSLNHSDNIEIIRSKNIVHPSDNQLEIIFNYMKNHIFLIKHQHLDDNVLCLGFFYHKKVMTTAAHCLRMELFEETLRSFNKLQITIINDTHENQLINNVAEEYFWQILPKSIRFEIFDFFGYITEVCNGQFWYRNDILIIKYNQSQERTINYKQNVRIGDVVSLIGIVPKIPKDTNFMKSGINVSNDNDVYRHFGNPGSFYLSLGKITYVDDYSVCYDAPNLMGTSGGPVLVIPNILNETSKIKFEFAAIHVGGANDFNNSCGLRNLFIQEELERSFFEQNFILLCALGWDLVMFFIVLILLKISFFASIELNMNVRYLLPSIIFGILISTVFAWIIVKFLNNFGLIWAMDLIMRKITGY